MSYVLMSKIISIDQLVLLIPILFFGGILDSIESIIKFDFCALFCHFFFRISVLYTFQIFLKYEIRILLQI